MNSSGSGPFRLRPLTVKDVSLTFEWRNSDRVRLHMFNSGALRADEHAAWVARMADSSDRCYFIYEIEGEPIGTIGLIWNDLTARKAEWSFYKGAASAPKGAGLHMMSLALAHFFIEMKGRKICAEVLADNYASLSAHDRLGFRLEGTRRAHVLHNGVFKDVMEYGLLRDSWKDQSHELWVQTNMKEMQ
jgi:UDP-4-amino-4,6-dideoxy-N-acetyl-beta-L-altrosamine N-acetyltransferase